MTWTPEETAARLAERQRYRAKHPEFDDWFLRVVARETLAKAELEAKRQRYRDWWASLSYLERCARRKIRKAGRGGRPLRRARMETLRREIVAAGQPEPEEWVLRAKVAVRERKERAEYLERRDAEREERDQAW